MAIKCLVRERCPRCGEIDAKIEGRFVRRGLHRCSNPIPGPPVYPQTLERKHVIFISGEGKIGR